MIHRIGLQNRNLLQVSDATFQLSSQSVRAFLNNSLAHFAEILHQLGFQLFHLLADAFFDEGRQIVPDFAFPLARACEFRRPTPLGQ
jgi:hypothetical protein